MWMRAKKKSKGRVGENGRRGAEGVAGEVGEKRSEVLQVRMSEEERREVMGAAERSGENLSVWGRRVLLEASGDGEVVKM